MTTMKESQDNLIEDILSGDLSLATIVLAVQCYIALEQAMYPEEYKKEGMYEKYMV